jgi:hypothetical protein
VAGFELSTEAGHPDRVPEGPLRLPVTLRLGHAERDSDVSKIAAAHFA